MANDHKIITHTKDGIKVQSILSETFLMLNRVGKAEIQLPASAANWILNIHFTHDDNIKNLAGKTTITQNGMDIYLNKWYGSSWIENIDPFAVSSKDETIKLLIKVRTYANEINDFRQVVISVWKKS